MTNSLANPTTMERFAQRILAAVLAFILAVFVFNFTTLDAHAASKCGETYKVQRGDSWHGIAKKCGVAFEDLRDANKKLAKKRGKNIRKGDQMVIPGAQQFGDCAPAMSFKPGDQVVVIDGVNNKVRWDPGKDAKVKRKRFRPGDVATVLNGPVCADGINWWEIDVNGKNLDGWTAEGKGKKIYLGKAGSQTAVSSGTWRACPNTYPSRLKKGQWVMVEDDKSNRIGSKPRKGNNVIGSLPPGVPVKITGGPQCNNGWVWWHVRSADGKIRGWTSEGGTVKGKMTFWLAPAFVRK